MLHGKATGNNGDEVRFTNVDFISFVAYNTYGKPAIIAPGTEDFAPASERGKVTVLYVNPANLLALQATKDAE